MSGLTWTHNIPNININVELPKPEEEPFVEQPPTDTNIDNNQNGGNSASSSFSTFHDAHFFSKKNIEHTMADIYQMSQMAGTFATSRTPIEKKNTESIFGSPETKVISVGSVLPGTRVAIDALKFWEDLCVDLLRYNNLSIQYNHFEWTSGGLGMLRSVVDREVTPSETVHIFQAFNGFRTMKIMPIFVFPGPKSPSSNCAEEVRLSPESSTILINYWAAIKKLKSKTGDDRFVNSEAPIDPNRFTRNGTLAPKYTDLVNFLYTFLQITLHTFNIPGTVLNAPGDIYAQMSYLKQNGIVDYVYANPLPALLFPGIKSVIYRCSFRSPHSNLYFWDKASVLTTFGLSREENVYKILFLESIDEVKEKINNLMKRQMEADLRSGVKSNSPLYQLLVKPGRSGIRHIMESIFGVEKAGLSAVDSEMTLQQDQIQILIEKYKMYESLFMFPLVKKKDGTIGHWSMNPDTTPEDMLDFQNLVASKPRVLGNKLPQLLHQIHTAGKYHPEGAQIGLDSTIIR